MPSAPEPGSAGEAGGANRREERVADEDAVWIERERIEPNPAQPRRTWSEASLRELGESLRRDGQLQACVVRPHPHKSGFYQLVSGERRWRASAPEFGNLARLRCTIRAATDDESFRLALVENLQREDLNDIDKAQAFVLLRDSLRERDPRVTWSHVGEAVGLSREYLQRLRALLDLPPQVQEMVRGGDLSGRSARALTGLKDAGLQIQLAQEIQAQKLSSDQALERARSLAGGAAQHARASRQANHAQAGAEDDTSGATGVRVTRGSRSSGAEGTWEEALRAAVGMLEKAKEQARAQALGGKSTRRRMQRLLLEARGHLDALDQAIESE